MGTTLATMFTVSTYGTWLRGDAGGWVRDGVIFSENPELEAVDRAAMNHEPYYFNRNDWLGIGQAIGESLRDRLNLRIYALTIQSWHSHGVIGATRNHIADVIKRLKDAVRWHLRIDRPVWAVDYDKRWCFDWPAVAGRINYVEKHNLRNGWKRQPWEFLKYPPELRSPACNHAG